MPRYRVTVEELAADPTILAGDDPQTMSIERLRMVVDSTGALDHSAIIGAVQKVRRVYTKRAPKAQA